MERTVKDWHGKIDRAVRDTMTNKEDSFKTAAQRWASEPQMYQQYRDLWKDGKDNKGDPLRDRLHAMQLRGPRARRNSAQAGHKLADEWDKLVEKHGPDEMAKTQDVMRIANEFGGHPDEALGVGKNAHLNDTLENMQAREVHPELQRKFKALHPEWQAHLLAEGKHFKDDLNAIRETNAKNFIEGIEPPEGSTPEQVVKRMLEGKLTEADEEHYAKWGVEGLDSDVFQNRKGLYFPAGRHGDFVVRGEHEVLTPLGSDREYHGAKLPDNVRRFDTEDALKDFLRKVNLPAKVTRNYYFDNPAGGRIYHFEDDDGNTRRVTADEAGIGYGAPQHEFIATVQNKRVEFAKTLADAQRIHDQLARRGCSTFAASSIAGAWGWTPVSPAPRRARAERDRQARRPDRRPEEGAESRSP